MVTNFKLKMVKLIGNPFLFPSYNKLINLLFTKAASSDSLN